MLNYYRVYKRKYQGKWFSVVGGVVVSTQLSVLSHILVAVTRKAHATKCLLTDD